MNKERLKNSKWLVNAYETVMNPLHALRYIVKRKMARLIESMKKSEIISYGDKNADKTFVILTPFSKCGIYSTILLNLPYIECIRRKGYYPIMDFQNYYNSMIQDEDKKGVENAWTYYYKQMDGFKIEEVYQSKNVILEWNRLKRVRIPNWNEKIPLSDREMKRWSKVLVDNLYLTDTIEQRVNNFKEKIFQDRKVLGVGIRAGYRALMLRKHPVIEGHPQVPDCEEMIHIVENKMKEWNYHYIFVSCDDREYFDKFRAHFKDRCLFMERALLHYFDNDYANIEWKDIGKELNTVSIRMQQEQYVEEIHLLAQCDSLYCCKGGGYQFAYILNGGKYKYFEAYNEGLIHLYEEKSI